jgi:endonuclease YncB( thermonuclease family)
MTSSLLDLDDPKDMINLIEQIESIQETMSQEEFISKEELQNLTDTDLCWVTAIIDGDTLYVSCEGDREIFQVRLLATDTAEVNGLDSNEECFGAEATTYVTYLLRNRAVTLFADGANEDEDPFGRKLRYVNILQPDGSWLNLSNLLLENGYAQFPSEYPTSYSEYFSKLESTAKDEKRGMWGACDSSEINMS